MHLKKTDCPFVHGTVRFADYLLTLPLGLGCRERILRVLGRRDARVMHVLHVRHVLWCVPFADVMQRRMVLASLGTEVLAEVILVSHGVAVVTQAVHVPILAGKVRAVLAVAVAAR